MRRTCVDMAIPAVRPQYAHVQYSMIGKRINRRTSALLEKNSLGELYISFAALTQIVERAVKARSEVKSSKTRVHAIGNSVRIDVRAETSPTVSLPAITHALEDAVNAAILAACGTVVGKTDVTIDQTAGVTKKRN